MCGIAGILSLDFRTPVDEARLVRMRDALKHRGPDGEGVFVGGPVGLGHRRLAIVDLAGGHQPMPNQDGSVWIVFNGEIYNHAALRARLEARGCRYRTRSDTETILHLYEQEGERCVERLRGMFAFAVWDRARSRLLLARDRLGIKPLYYAFTGQELLFASEIKALLAAGLRPRLEPAVLPEYLATGFVAGEDTFLQGVRRLLPAHTLTLSAEGAPPPRRYWRIPPPREDDGGAPAAAGADLRARLTDAVQSHLMSDVPLGMFLSGGIDSSGLLALMSRLVKEPVRSFSVGFQDRESDERPYARLAARAAGAEHREVVVSPAEFFRALPRLVWHEDEPIAFPSSVALYFVSELASRHVKVVLTGEGSDELFLGYNRYRVTAWNERFGRAYWGAVPAGGRAGVRAMVARLPRRMRRYAQRSFLSLEPGPRGVFYENFAVFPHGLRQRLFAPAGPAPDRDPFGYALRCYQEAEGGALDRMSRADLQTYLVRLLMKQDQMSMAASVESRVPFLDHELVEAAAALPARFKLRGLTTKAVLREALDGLVPDAILHRSKKGFPTPVGRWLRGPFWPLVEELVLSPRALRRGWFDPASVRELAEEHRRGLAAHGDRLWLLLNLEIWQRVFLEGEDADAMLRAA